MNEYFKHSVEGKNKQPQFILYNLSYIQFRKK